MRIRPLYEFDGRWQEYFIREHLAMQRGGKVTGPIEGTYGSIYSIEVNWSLRVAAKCPHIRRFGTPAEARYGIENILHELEKTHQLAVHTVSFFGTGRLQT